MIQVSLEDLKKSQAEINQSKEKITKLETENDQLKTELDKYKNAILKIKGNMRSNLISLRYFEIDQWVLYGKIKKVLEE